MCVWGGVGVNVRVCERQKIWKHRGGGGGAAPGTDGAECRLQVSSLCASRQKLFRGHNPSGGRVKRNTIKDRSGGEWGEEEVIKKNHRKIQSPLLISPDGFKHRADLLYLVIHNKS